MRQVLSDVLNDASLFFLNSLMKNSVFKFLFVICDYLFIIIQLWLLSILNWSVGIVSLRNEIIRSLASTNKFIQKAEDL